MTYRDKGSYESSPPCMTHITWACLSNVWYIQWMTHMMWEDNIYKLIHAHTHTQTYTHTHIHIRTHILTHSIQVHVLQVQPIPLGVTFSNAVFKLKAQSSKLERLFSLKRGKRDFRALSFSFRKCHPRWDWL